MKDQQAFDRLKEKLDSVEGKGFVQFGRSHNLKKALDNASGFTDMIEELKAGLETVLFNKKRKLVYGEVAFFDRENPDTNFSLEIGPYEIAGIIDTINDELEESRFEGFSDGFPQVKVCPETPYRGRRHITTDENLVQMFVPDKKNRYWVYSFVPW